jgi:hypothetical protein
MKGDSRFETKWPILISLDIFLVFGTNLKCSYQFKLICICNLFVHIRLQEKISQMITLPPSVIGTKSTKQPIDLGNKGIRMKAQI